jgi:hypothetical protein
MVKKTHYRMHGYGWQATFNHHLCTSTADRREARSHEAWKSTDDVHKVTCARCRAELTRDGHFTFAAERRRREAAAVAEVTK